MLACSSTASCTLYNPRGRGGRLAVPMDWPSKIKPAPADVPPGGEVLDPHTLRPLEGAPRGSWVVVSEPGARAAVEKHVGRVVRTVQPRLLHAVRLYTTPTQEVVRILRESSAPLVLPCGNLWRSLPLSLPCGSDSRGASLAS